MIHRKVFITPTSTQPRFKKRIKASIEKGEDIIIFSFKRNHQLINDFGNKFNVDYLETLEDGKYLSRISKLVKSFNHIKNKINSKDLIYSFGLDITFFSILFFSSHRIVMEIGDIRTNKKSAFNFLYSKLDNFIFGNINKLVVTSPAFKKYYLDKFPDLEVEIIENKIDRNDLNYYKIKSNFEISKDPTKITIGILGLLRYNSIIDLLNQYKNSSIFNFSIIGDGRLVEEIKNFQSKYNNIKYYGPFKNPDDLFTLYNAIDVNFVVYDIDLNVKLALPNKLYESIYFEVPMIVSKGTFLYEKVKKMGIGKGVEKDSSGKINFELENDFNEEEIKNFKKKFKKIDKSYTIL